MKHTLVIGGTGMLFEVSKWLVEQGFRVSVVARKPLQMDKLVEAVEQDSRLTPLLVDYTDNSSFREALKSTLEKNGEIHTAVIWIHSYAKQAIKILLEELSAYSLDVQLFHILGSNAKLEKVKKAIEGFFNGTYHQVQLGFKIDRNHSRWLSEAEISEGIIKAIIEKKR
ncbi:short-chain dehydrogenase [Bacillus sp. B1-b2]|uniref:short-chain dehydrogenase n=1 Tax=Bacillus sp. B1-b2 TaxID=2653201 RepID=UPI001262531C|nr:short-chain dehydrogenase [Bacillus sp. B1-b2]KAB7667101.1 short-chain dehydrogenase [Bacillus sp. B1-b2]